MTPLHDARDVPDTDLTKPPSYRSKQSFVKPASPASFASPLLTAQDLADRWRVPKSHVYRMSRERDLPTVKIGRYFRYRLSAVEAWECEQEAREP